MNNPVIFKLAKLLKEKGFEGSCHWYYDGYHKKYVECLPYTGINNLNGDIETPTIAEVIVWLYEKHGIWMWIEKYENESQFVPQIPKANLQKVLGFYNSPTEAYLAAIEYVLKKLI